jgi:GTP-binding protein EngB required for normal cell division
VKKATGDPRMTMLRMTRLSQRQTWSKCDQFYEPDVASVTEIAFIGMSDPGKSSAALCL